MPAINWIHSCGRLVQINLAINQISKTLAHQQNLSDLHLQLQDFQSEPQQPTDAASSHQKTPRLFDLLILSALPPRFAYSPLQ